MPDTDFGTYTLTGWRAMFLSLAQKMPTNWLGKRLALICRKLVLMNGPKIIDSSIDSIHFRLHMGDNVSERKFLFMPQFFDADERRLLHTYLSRQSLSSTSKPAPAVFIDIGANAGIYSLTAAKAGAEVLAIEPNPVVVQRLQQNLAFNQFDKPVRIIQKGVSDASGYFDLHLDHSNLGGSSLLASPHNQKSASISIPCERLETLLSEAGIQRITALKIDIEGAEDKALVPFFEHAPPDLFPELLIMENSTHLWQKDLQGVLHSKGYQFTQKTRMNHIWTLNPDTKG